MTVITHHTQAVHNGNKNHVDQHMLHTRTHNEIEDMKHED